MKNFATTRGVRSLRCATGVGPGTVSLGPVFTDTIDSPSLETRGNAGLSSSALCWDLSVRCMDVGAVGVELSTTTEGAADSQCGTKVLSRDADALATEEADLAEVAASEPRSTTHRSLAKAHAKVQGGLLDDRGAVLSTGDEGDVRVVDAQLDEGRD
eukprot:Opistho-1_new@20407